MAVAPHSASLSCRDLCCVSMSGWRCGTAEGIGDARLDLSAPMPYGCEPVPCGTMHSGVGGAGAGLGLVLQHSQHRQVMGKGMRGHWQVQVEG